MSLELKIFVPENTVAEGKAAGYLSQALDAIGFSRRGSGVNVGPTPETVPAGEPSVPASAEEAPKATRGRPRKAKEDEPEARNISADPENRVDPAQAEADAKQDAEDEAAEVDANRDAKKPLTTEDVKAAMTAYVTKYGLSATQEDGPDIFTEALGKPPAGESYWKLSILPDDQELLQKVVDIWGKAVELNPKKRALAS